MPIDHLPPRWRPTAHRVRDWSMTNGPALLVLGLGIIARGISYLGSAAPPVHPAELLMPITWWAVVWLTIGVVCLVAAAIPRAQPLAVGGGVGLHAVWALSFLTDSVIDHNRSWVSAVGYVSVALLVMWAVWRGSREIIPEGAVAHELRRD